MSQNNNRSNQAQRNKLKNEEFFDVHPRPWDVEPWEINEYLRIFLDPTNPETFLVEIKFLHWTEAKYRKALVSKIFEHSDIQVYRIGKSLFLRRLLF